MFLKKILLAYFMFASFSAVGNETWLITSLNWEPYSGDEMTNQGNSIQKLRNILKKDGITLNVEFYPWKRAQEMALKKGYIGYYPAWPEEVGEGFVASKPVDWSEISVLKRTGATVEFSSIDELFERYDVGIVKSYVYPNEISQAMKKYPSHVEGASNEMSLLKKISKGRNNVAITDPNVMLYLADKNGILNIELVKTLMQKELVVALRNDDENKARIERINKLLSEINN
ncbi:substrate-binding periplasmic protein [Zooshikella ganghwensis]|uniref:substrate-binding periplasmic protein n=1 Tax=Zooshikella ganghwensis TaxID=202772 RepID=UPI000413E9FB|nr:transporter substrate-binding domain-containing protein [Zooshikella ganghwensis]